MGNSSDFAAEFVHGLSERAWAAARIGAWVNDPGAAPALLIRGSPGSGKSTLLAMYLASLTAARRPEDGQAPRVIASILRHPRYQQPFDSVHFLNAVVQGLEGIASSMSALPLETPPVPQITVTQNVGSGEARGVVFELGTTAASGLRALAEQRVRATPASARALIVIDALDQAEDEGADDFLRAVAGLVRAAEGTGVRILCTSRTKIPVWLDPSRRTDLDLVEDADDLNAELREYLRGRFAGLDREDRDRVVDALVNGAQGNWLWASTNAAALEREIADSGTVPSHIALSEGLSGLYSDGWLRIRQRLASHSAELQVKRILGVVACSFTGSLGVQEIRWATDIEPDDIVRLVHECEPFLKFDEAGNARVFHPDFSRWLFRSKEVGLSESSEHLRLARGLTRYGKAARWRLGAGAYATNWVLNHWCSVRILDPFRPDAASDEEELEAIVADPDWGAQSGSALETLDQLGLLAPAVRFPQQEFPLSVGLRTLLSSAIVDRYQLCRIMADLDDDEITRLAEAEEGYRKWLEAHLPDLPARLSRIVWGGLLAGRFVITRAGAGITVGLSAPAVTEALRGTRQRIGHEGRLTAELAVHVPAAERPALLDGLRALLNGAPDATMAAKVRWAIGHTYRVQAAEQPAGNRAEDLEQAVAAYHDAWQAVPAGGEDRLNVAIDLANALRELPVHTLRHLDMLVTVQGEIRDLRRALGDPSWPASANRLGDACRDRAAAQAGDAARAEDLALALAAYTEAWQAVPPGHQDRLTFVIDVANLLLRMPDRTAEQIELLVTAQREIRDVRQSTFDPGWPVAANLLGDAYRARAGIREDPQERAQDLTRALLAYAQAWLAVPPGHQDKMTFAIDLANTLRELPERSADQRDLLIMVQTEILAARRAAEDGDWPWSANLLGDAYRERAGSQPDDRLREADLLKAVAAYHDAWQAVPEGHDDRLTVAINLANTLLRLPRPTAEQVELLITAQGEIRELRRAAYDTDWPTATNLLGRAYRERAEVRGGEGGREEDLALALAAFTEAWQGVPPDHQDRLSFGIDVANTVRDLPRRTADHVELLITVQAEIARLRRAAGDPTWPRSVNRLGDAYRERAGTRADAEARAADLALALAAYAEAWSAVPADHEDRLMFSVDLANVLRELPDRSADQLEQLIAVQTQIRDARRAAGDAAWTVDSKLLGDAYRLRARTRDDDGERAADQVLALEAYTLAWQAVPGNHENRLTFAIGVANTLLELRERTADQLELLITLATEIRDGQRAAGDSGWPRSADLLGDAFRERAGTRADPAARAEDLALALASYTQAWQAVPPDHEDRLMYAIDMADVLRDLAGQSAAQLEQLILVQREIRDVRRERGDLVWSIDSKLLGDAYRLRARTRDDDPARAADLALALEAYRLAWEAVPLEHENRLTFAIDVANTLLELPERPAAELELLVTAQAEILQLRRAAGHPAAPRAANLLGRAYRERAAIRTDLAAREDDLALAVAAYREAWQATPAGHEDQLRYAIDLANTLVVHAAAQPASAPEHGRAVMNQALELVSAAVSGRQADNLTELRDLLPVLSVQFVRQQWAWI